MGNPLTMHLGLGREYSGKGSLQVCCATHIHWLATDGERMLTWMSLWIDTGYFYWHLK